MHIVSRLLIAVLHFNENSGRQQSMRKDGMRQWAVTYAKQNKGKGVVKQVKVPCTYGM